MKLIILLALMFPCFGATNTNTVATLNAHERFYANYRARKAQLEKGIVQLEDFTKREDAISKKRLDVGATAQQAFSPEGQRAHARLHALKIEVKKLDLARLEYEKRFPEAVGFAYSPPVRTDPPARRPVQRVIIEPDRLTPNQRAGAYVGAPPPRPR